VDEFLARCKRFQPPPELAAIAELVAAHHAKGSAARTASIPAAQSRWREIGRGEMLR
jgi:hypothetical protein